MNGETVKKILHEYGLSQQAVADLLGISPQNLNNLLSRDDIRTGLLENISEKTRIPISVFFGDSYNVGNNSFVVSGDNVRINNSCDACIAELSRQRTSLDKSQRQVDRLIRLLDKTLDAD